MWKWICPLLVGSIACSPSADTEALRNLNSAFAAAMNAGDVDAIVSLITADVVMMPPGAPPVRGVDAVRATFDGVFAAVALHETWTSEELVIAGAGELAYDWSSYVVTITPRGEGEPSTELGQNFFVARRQQDGTWKYSRLIWNRDEAPSGG
jgi:uncharacterized protein (TIGR02246 family)